MSGRLRPNFAPVPRDLAVLLRRGELTREAWLVLMYLVVASDWQTKEYDNTLRGLADDLDWARALTLDYLSKLLRSLRDEGWLDFESRPGPRARYVISFGPRLLRLLYEPDEDPGVARPPNPGRGSDGNSDGISDYRQGPKSETRSPETENSPGPNPHGYPVSERSTQRAVRDSQEVDVDRDEDIEPSGGRPASGPIAKELVREYVNSCRALGFEPPKRLVGQVAQQVGQLLDEGQMPQDVSAAVALLIESRQHPSTLASFIPEAVAGPRVMRRAKSDLDREYEELLALGSETPGTARQALPPPGGPV